MIDVLSNINAKVTILRASTAIEASGYPTEGYFDTVAWKVPCYIEQRSGNEAVQYGGDRQVRNGFAVFPPTVAVPQSGDILVWGSRRLKVQSVNPVQDNIDLLAFTEADWEETSGES